MTTIVQFLPAINSSPPFSFSPVFDRATYNATVTWNFYGQRWYLNVYDNSGTLIYCRPLIASPPNYDINLNYGYFTTPMVFREASQNFEIG